MAGATVCMKAEKQYRLQNIHEKIHYIEGAEQISKSVCQVNGVEIWVLAYEKFYMRTGSYASLTITLTEYQQEQTACIIACGGGNGIVNNSFGANRNFAKACVQALETCGFSVTKSDLDPSGKGIVERFFK